MVLDRFRLILRTRIFESILNISLRVLLNTPQRIIQRLLLIFSKIAWKSESKNFIQLLQYNIEINPNVFQILRRFMLEVNPRCRKKLIRNLIVNYACGVANKKRNKFRKEVGFSPITYMISPTMRCNLNCVGCYAGAYSKMDLPIQDLDRIIREGKEIGLYFVTILGGEPFISDDMWKIYQSHSDVLFQVFTNGTLLDDELINRIVSLGNVIPVISIEGFEMETDFRRGKGTYKKIIQLMENLHKVGVLFGFSCTVTKNNMETIISDDFINLLLEKGALFGWHFLYVPVGINPDINLMPTPLQRKRMLLEGARKIRLNKPIFVIDFSNDAPYVGGCMAGGREIFHINSQGDVEPCVFAHFAVDNIREKSLKKILTSDFFQSIRKRQPFSSNLLLSCMLVDHPLVFKNILAEIHPYATHKGATEMVEQLNSDLSNYSNELSIIQKQEWEEDKTSHGFDYLLKEPLKVILKKKNYLQ